MYIPDRWWYHSFTPGIFIVYTTLYILRIYFVYTAYIHSISIVYKMHIPILYMKYVMFIYCIYTVCKLNIHSKLCVYSTRLLMLGRRAGSHSTGSTSNHIAWTGNNFYFAPLLHTLGILALGHVDEQGAPGKCCAWQARQTNLSSLTSVIPVSEGVPMTRTTKPTARRSGCWNKE